MFFFRPYHQQGPGGARGRKALGKALPEIEYLPGWKQDISSARRWEDLPRQAQEYVGHVERAIGCPIAYISVGPERDSVIRV